MPKTFVLPKDERDDALIKLAVFLRSFAPGKKVKVEISQYVATRSAEQNRYLWGVCYKALEDATGQEAADWHEYMLGNWSGWEVYELMGQKRRHPKRRSSVLNKTDFSDYVVFIQQHAAQHGIHIPDPDPELAKGLANE